jgi:hypothetical protein
MWFTDRRLRRLAAGPVRESNVDDAGAA